MSPFRTAPRPDARSPLAGPAAAVFLAAAAALSLAACGVARTVEGATGGLACSSCHGSAENAAPPRSTTGATSTSDRSVGAHQAHVQGGAIGAPIACGECHPVPASIDAPGHADGRVDVRFGETASIGGTAAWDREAATCAVYCHGTTIAGGATPRPVWTQVDGTQDGCGSCHGAPPPPPHPAMSACAVCHPGTVRPDGAIDVAAGLHVNGKVDVDVTAACGTCHGIPPATGRHQEHVSEGISCGTCHAGFTPSSAGPTHLNGVVDVSAPGWNPSTASCANACHGTHSWNGGGD